MERSRIEIIWKWAKIVFPVVIGGVGGYMYYSYVGCNGSCPISGNPYVSTAYGAFWGFLFVDWKPIFRKLFKKEVKENK